MTARMKIYIGLLTLGVLLVGTGVGLLFISPLTIDIPEGEPVITMSNSYRIIGRGPARLRIYEDGALIYYEEEGIPPDSTRTWRTGQLQQEELDSLLAFFQDSHFESLGEIYQFPGEQISGATKTGGMSCAISINYGDLDKTVHADWYLTPDGGITYPDMPYPLNEIYRMLKQIAENSTREVAREPI